MKCIMVMFDSLNRRMLPPYGCEWTHAPEFFAAGEADGAVSKCVRVFDAVHAGAAGAAHGPAEFFASELGAAGAV